MSKYKILHIATGNYIILHCYLQGKVVVRESISEEIYKTDGQDCALNYYVNPSYLSNLIDSKAARLFSVLVIETYELANKILQSEKFRDHISMDVLERTYGECDILSSMEFEIVEVENE